MAIKKSRIAPASDANSKRDNARVGRSNRNAGGTNRDNNYDHDRYSQSGTRYDRDAKDKGDHA